MLSLRFHLGGLVCALLVTVGLAGTAHAQASFDLQTFRPSPHGEAFVSVESGAIPQGLDVRAQLFLQYLYRPLQLESISGRRVLGLVDHRFDMTLLGSIALWDRVSFGLSIPATLYQGGQLANAASGATQNLQSVAFGDLVLQPKVGILDQKRHFIDLAVNLVVTLPTSTRGAFAGDKTVSVGGDLDVSRRFGPVRAALNGGFQWRETNRFFNLEIGPELYYKGGVGFDFSHYFKAVRVELMAELFGRTSAKNPFSKAVLSPLEWVVAARWILFTGVDLTVGGGRGILPGYGSPAARVFLALAVTPFAWCKKDEKAPASEPYVDPDRDHDGIANDKDKCPDVAEDKDNFEDGDGCPEADNDKDGLADAQDKCPDVAEDKDSFEDDDGCPEADNDKDGVPDAQDKCVNVAEDKDGVQDDDGCPEDNDGDGIPDDKDKCPNEAETINGVEDDDGCPDKGETLVVMKGEKIDILQKVQFKTGKAELSPASFNLLNQVAAVLKNHAEINKVRVEGHTDSVGARDKNMALSQARAEAVKAYLVAQGVAADRLEAVGFGPDKPIASNATAKGKEINRRVAFTIVQDDAPPTVLPVKSGEPEMKF